MPVPFTVRGTGLAVDLILFRLYGRQEPQMQAELIEQTLLMNPGLAALGVILPLGTTFDLPDLPPVTPETVKVEGYSLFGD